jgi:uncharacterized protein YozE (UPF0346 family)
VDYVRYFKKNQAPDKIIHALEAAFAKFAPFKNWVSELASDPDVGADIQRFGAMVKQDTAFPDQGTLDDYMNYLDAKGAPAGVKKALRQSFKKHSVTKHFADEKEEINYMGLDEAGDGGPGASRGEAARDTDAAAEEEKPKGLFKRMSLRKSKKSASVKKPAKPQLTDGDFKQYLISKATELGPADDGPLAKLGRLAQKDESMPAHGTVVDYVKYFKGNGAPPQVIHALEAAFAEYAPFKSFLEELSSDPSMAEDIKKFGQLVKQDTAFPDQGTMDDYMKYLNTKGAPEKVKDVLRSSFKRYSVHKH